MPFNPKQNALFHAAANNPAIAAKYGIKVKDAQTMAGEGVVAQPRVPKPRKPKTNALTAMVMP